MSKKSAKRATSSSGNVPPESATHAGASQGAQDAVDVFKSQLDEGILETLSRYELPDQQLGQSIELFGDACGECAAASESFNEENLQDAWFAEYPAGFQELQEEAIIERDDRVQVTDTRDFPFRSICHLRIKTKAGRYYIGTGWFNGPRTIITAGHCVYVHRQGGYVSDIEIFPARNGSYQPLTLHPQDLVATAGWRHNKSQESDYGAIILSQGPGYGYFGFDSFSRADLERILPYVVGYPGDKPKGTMWGHGRRLSRVYPNQIRYAIDTYGGQSGAPVFARFDGDDYVAIGIHNYGGSQGNLATRINAAVRNDLQRWRSI